MQSDERGIGSAALDHAWDWFSLHANQRIQTFNFYLISVAFLVAGYGALLEKNPTGSAIIGLAGAVLSICFNRLDARNKELIRAGERAMEACEDILASESGMQAIRIVASVSTRKPFVPTYSAAFAVIELLIGVVFVLGAMLAFSISHSGPTAAMPIVASEVNLVFASTRSVPKIVNLWQPGSTLPLQVENDCPQIASTSSFGGGWRVHPFRSGDCYLIVHGAGNQKIRIRVRVGS